MTQPAPEQHEDAFRQVMAHRTMLAAYVRAIVHDRNLAEDILADVSVEIVRSWGRYDPSRPFGPWARGLARRVALAGLRKHGKLPSLLDNGSLEALGAAIDAHGDEARLAERRAALKQCMERLPERDRDLLRQRYFDDRAYEDISRAVERSVGALYAAFSRIHKALRDCIQRRMSTA